MSLIDDLIQGASKEISKIQARSQEMIKAYTLEQEIKELDQQKTDQLAAIGRSIFDKYQKQIEPNEESLQKQCKEIAALEKDIAHLQKQLVDLKAQKATPSKGSASNNIVD